MEHISLEHANFTVADLKNGCLDASSFWVAHTRAGPGTKCSYTVHVGTGAQYVALYRPVDLQKNFRLTHMVFWAV